MEYHICTEIPCPVEDKEIRDRLLNGFEIRFTNNTDSNPSST